ncbi:hypothetical protein D9619_009363 [Psilocybe cf. subviscida]|uniref:Uncharacterized protein n=1 Tax=Psilocybe cf. subviscida TaxID=2480587 RepID=A0A8H5BWB4_9AGAR|nr:hypothetical protein D9619_009363 [Psilocybe cf. subviscida]
MASYDSTLLASAPAATKSQLQEGYATDLLEKPTASPSQSRPDLHNGSSSNIHRDVERQQPLPPTKAKVPWYRTTKGIIILAVAFIVIIAAAVGGGVGGSKKKKNNDDAVSQGAGSAGAGGQSGAGAPAGSSTAAAGSSTTEASQGAGGGQTPSGTPTPSDPAATPTQGGQTPPTPTNLPSIFSLNPTPPITQPVVGPTPAANT